MAPYVSDYQAALLGICVLVKKAAVRGKGVKCMGLTSVSSCLFGADGSLILCFAEAEAAEQLAGPAASRTSATLKSDLDNSIAGAAQAFLSVPVLA